jgi:hypothetical protein
MAGAGGKDCGFETTFCRRRKQVEEQRSAKKEATVGSSSALRKDQDEEGCARCCCCLSLREEGAKLKRWPVDFPPFHVIRERLPLPCCLKGLGLLLILICIEIPSKQAPCRTAAQCRATTAAPPFDPLPQRATKVPPRCRPSAIVPPNAIVPPAREAAPSNIEPWTR